IRVERFYENLFVAFVPQCEVEDQPLAHAPIVLGKETEVVGAEAIGIDTRHVTNTAGRVVLEVGQGLEADSFGVDRGFATRSQVEQGTELPGVLSTEKRELLIEGISW